MDILESSQVLILLIHPIQFRNQICQQQFLNMWCIFKTFNALVTFKSSIYSPKVSNKNNLLRVVVVKSSCGASRWNHNVFRGVMTNLSQERPNIHPKFLCPVVSYKSIFKPKI